MSNAWSKGSDTRWRAFRQGILERDKWTCVIGTVGVCTVQAQHVDHIIPLEMGGEKYDPLNCRASCQPCNLHRSKRTVGYAQEVDNTDQW